MNSPLPPISRLRRAAIVVVPIVLGVLVSGAISKAAPMGFYAPAQAAQGQTVYTSRCAQCHGTNLQGQSGPALVGDQFRKSYASGTAAQLYDFISRQMPADAPGSLSQQAYLNVTAFILSKNGYPSGNVPLGPTTLGQLKLGGVRITPAKTGVSGISAEIVRAAPPSRHVYSGLPPGANVAITDAMLRGAANDSRDWLVTGRTYANDRYSPLRQIDASNVRSLVPVAIVQTGMTASFETTPLIVGGVMYITTGVVNNQMKIMALNAATGSPIWDSTYNLGSFQICCGPVNRGPALAYGRLYAVTLDNKLLALDATNGKPVFSTTIADASVGYSETLAPQVYNGMVIVGSAGGEWPLRGFVAAYDAKSGKQLWRWNSTDPKTYGGDSWKRGGSMVWTTPAIDTQRGLIIFSTGNPNPDLDGTSRPGDNLYSDSIVALDAKTGKLRWYYQEVKHDVWDYDAVSPVVLFDVHRNGQTIPAAGEAGKVGWFFIVDRRNGKLIRKSDPYVMMSKNMFTTPTRAGVNMLTGANGGAEWSPPAYSPQTHLVYILAMDQLMKFTTKPTPYVQGQIRLGSAFTNVVKGGIQDGPFVAINVETGKIAWQYKAPQPLIGGALATAGNVVFMGEGNGWFDAFNASNGQRLWRFQLGAGVNAPPVSYEVNGVQYIAVAAGGNFQLSYPYGDAVAIFKLASTK
jgi:alcohol dehydrogenase (cytochrome c)